MKKFICVILSMVLLISVSISAFAKSESEVAAEDLETYGIIDRNALGDLTIEGPVTRATMTKMLVLMLDINPNKTNTIFSDVPADHWASGFISTAVERGIVNGMGDGTFLTDEYVTYQQAIKMVVSALGYGEDAERKGGYPYGYIMVGSSLGITPNGVSVISPADRGEIMIMLSKALDVPLMVKIEEENGTVYKVQNGKDGESLVTMRTELEEED